MTDLERLIIRAWSAITAAGDEATAEAIADRVGLDAALVARHLTELRIKGQLPPEEAASA